MMPDRRLHFCIHGAGGLGSLVGGYLAHAGHDVTLVGRAPHVAAIRRNGLRITGRRGEIGVRDRLRAVTHPSEVEQGIDYYILLTKVKDSTTALAEAGAIAARVQCALTLQNGIGKEQVLIDCFGAEKVIGGSIIEGATMTAPGEVHNHVTVPVTAYFGELDGRSSLRTETLATAFCAADLGAQSVANIEHVIWEKAIQVGGASAWSASTLVGNPALDYWDGLADASGAAHYVQIAKELLAVYGALGYAPQNFFAPLSKLKEIDAMPVDKAISVMVSVGREHQIAGRTPVRTSMHGDVLAGRKTEIDVIIKPVLDAARAHGVAAPTLTGAYRTIKTLESYMS